MSDDEIIATGLHGDQEWRLKRYQDPDVENPRTFSPMWTLVMNHRRRALGDKQMDGDDFADFKEEEGLNTTNCIEVPIYAYEHGGIAFSVNRTGQFTDRFDAGQIGVAYLTVAKLKEEYGADTEENRQTARTVLEGELETYQQYIEGETYGFTYEERPANSLEENAWEDKDSCGGFFGADPVDNGMLDHLEQHVRDVLNPPKPEEPAPPPARRRRTP